MSAGKRLPEKVVVPTIGTSTVGDAQVAPVTDALAPLCERIADRVAALILERLAVPAAPAAPAAVPLAWTCADVARELGRSVDWVRDHRADLGVLPASGPRPRLLFDPSAVRAWATACQSSNRSQAQSAPPLLGSGRRRRPVSGTGVDLLPIAGDRRAA